MIIYESIFFFLNQRNVQVILRIQFYVIEFSVYEELFPKTKIVYKYLVQRKQFFGDRLLKVRRFKILRGFTFSRIQSEKLTPIKD